MLVVEYDSDIESKEIIPPIGGRYAWAAKAWVKKVGAGRSDDVRYLHEHHGETRVEAESKAQAELDEWLARQQYNSS